MQLNFSEDFGHLHTRYLMVEAPVRSYRLAYQFQLGEHQCT